MKCPAEDKQWGERRQSWEKATTVRESAITKVRDGPDRKLWNGLLEVSACAQLQKHSRLDVYGPKEVFYILKMMELLSETSVLVISPSQKVFNHSKTSLKVQQGGPIDSLCPGTRIDHSRRITRASKRDREEVLKEIILAVLPMVERNICVVPEGLGFVEESSRFQEL